MQEKIKGEEFYFDLSSFNGQHHFTAAGRYTKDYDSPTFEYHYLDGVDLHAPEIRDAKRYVLNCLEALGMRNGLGHVEIMRTESGEYKLIEINPRISGAYGYVNLMSCIRYNTDQVDAYVKMLENLPQSAQNQSIHQRLFFFKNRRCPYSHIDLSAIQTLSSYAKSTVLKPSCTTDEPAAKTLIDTVMLVLLAGADLKTIEQDTKALIQLEASAECLKD